MTPHGHNHFGVALSNSLTHDQGRQAWRHSLTVGAHPGIGCAAVPLPRHFGLGFELLMSETTTATNQTGTGDKLSKGWSVAIYWGLHGWVLAYVGVLLGAFSMQFIKGEFPCPLCMLQRYGMILSTLGALWVILQARQNTLTPARYTQGLGMGVLGALTGLVFSTRQILLHILPGDPGYGEPVLGLHLYSWAAVTFIVVILFAAIAAMAAPKAFPTAPPAGSALRLISTIIIWIFVAILIANVIAIIFLEGFAFALPDDPDSYNLINQLTGR